MNSRIMRTSDETVTVVRLSADKDGETIVARDIVCVIAPVENKYDHWQAVLAEANPDILKGDILRREDGYELQVLRSATAKGAYRGSNATRSERLQPTGATFQEVIFTYVPYYWNYMQKRNRRSKAIRMPLPSLVVNRVPLSHWILFLRVSLRLTGFSCQEVVTLTLAIMMNPGIMLRVLVRLGALANRAMRLSWISAKRHLRPIYLFSESAAGFK